MVFKRRKKGRRQALLVESTSRLSLRWGGKRKLRGGYFCLYFVLPPEFRDSLLCAKCPDREQCKGIVGPSRRWYDKLIGELHATG
jgi:hypothetical protein